MQRRYSSVRAHANPARTETARDLRYQDLAVPHEHDKQRDRALDDSLHLREQSLVLSSRGGTLREQRAGLGALVLCKSEEVCAR